jgi:MFS family permease
LTLAAAQFLMTLDTSVMNVAIATVAKDVGTTVTGIQFAITLYTLVMAAFMITGGKIGQIIGRKRAFMIGCVVYGCGSGVTALSKSLPVLILGWSVLEGLGAALILPAVVALVATNFARAERPRAYGLVASAGAVAVAVGPLVGGLFTTYASWRWVFAGEVIMVIGILALTRRMADSPAVPGVRLDPVGTLLSAVGLGMIVYGVIRSGTWGFVQPKPDAPQWLGMSPVVWLLLGGGAVLGLFVLWENRRLQHHRAALLDPRMLKVPRLQGGLTSFFFQFMLQSGLFFVIPLFLSVALGLSAVATGVRLLPLSLTLLASAVGVPKLFPHASPRRIVRIGFGLLFLGIVVLLAALDSGAGADIVTGPLLLIGLGIGTLASQLGAVTVSAVPDSQSGEVGGVQNTVTNLGASIGTALSGAILIAVLTTTFLGSVSSNSAIPKELSSHAQVELSSGIPFVSDADLDAVLQKADVPPAAADAVVAENAQSRINGLRAALAVLALIALIALAMTRRLPTVQPGDEQRDTEDLEPEPT